MGVGLPVGKKLCFVVGDGPRSNCTQFCSCWWSALPGKRFFPCWVGCSPLQNQIAEIMLVLTFACPARNLMKLPSCVGNARESKRPRRCSPSWRALRERHFWPRWGGRALLQNPIAEIVVTFVFRLLFGVSDEIEFLRGRPLGDQTLLISGCFAVKSSTEKFVSTLGPSQS